MNRIQKRIILDALDEPESLSDWENDFINDMADKGDEYQVSEKQNQIINRIGNKLAGG
jgi:hypothetical protein